MSQVLVEMSSRALCGGVHGGLSMCVLVACRGGQGRYSRKHGDLQDPRVTGITQPSPRIFIQLYHIPEPASQGPEQLLLGFLTLCTQLSIDRRLA